VKQLLLLLCIVLAANSGHAQRSISLPHNYYRSSPFSSEFSNFVQHLLNDPTLVNKTVRKKTDTTLFFIEGDYASHHPFFFKSSRTRIILSEKEEITVKDSQSFVTTVFNYQIIGYAPPGIDGVDDIKGEFEKCCRRYKKGFDHYTEQMIKAGEATNGAVRDYSFVDLPYHPLTLAWATSGDHSENIFAITIRFQVTNNIAFIPLETRLD